MQAGLNAVAAALDGACEPVNFFVRDDDAGWDDVRLVALLDCTRRAGVPIDLAVIPQAVSPQMARALRVRMSDVSGVVAVHQHGFAHVNHESTARKCEFGDSRPIAIQRRDLRAGWERLQELFEVHADPIFTPPWNRCSAATPALLAELGYAALSRDRSAPLQHCLPELPVDLDWCKERRMSESSGRCSGEAIGLALARRIRSGSAAGLMLHHAQMDTHDLDLLAALLGAISRHPRARWLPMRELIALRAGLHGADSTRSALSADSDTHPHLRTVG